MKVKLTPGNLVAFFALVFLVHEVHDWLHFLTSAIVCGCLGNRSFDMWTPCIGCEGAHFTGVAMATLLPPLLVNGITMWVGMGLMQSENPPEKQSLGFALVFAALPYPHIMAAVVGGGDETSALRMLFAGGRGGNHLIAGIGLLIVLAVCIPPLFRAFMILTGWLGKLVVVPAFLLIPNFVDHWLVGGLLNRLLKQGILSHQMLRGGTQLFVFVWLLVLIVLVVTLWRRLESLLEYRELSV